MARTQCVPLRLVLLALALAVGLAAAPYSAVVVYGDSLSDNGNLFAVAGQPGPPYYNGRASNGPVAVEVLASLLGAPLVDFAWDGATTGIGNHLDGGSPTSFGAFSLPGMTTLYDATVGGLGPVASTALFVVWGGPDDFLSPSSQDTTPQAVANRAVANIVAIVAGLQAAGATHILVPGLPDLGLTPFLRSQGAVAAAQASLVSDYFNQRLMATLPAGVIFFDTANLLRMVVANPGAFGFTNATDACFVSSVPSLCSNPAQYVFFDDLHPTARANEIVGASFAAAVAIPEPASAGLVVAAACLMAVRARRMSGRRAGNCTAAASDR